MKELLTRYIKDVMKEFPATQKVLTEFGIGCTSCNLGICLLKDIVDIHNLSQENELKLWQKIGEIVFAGQKFEIPKIERKVKQKSNDTQFCPPIRELVDEHKVIMRLINKIPALLKTIDLKQEADKQILRNAIDFIRMYADAFHHAKEEKILFGFFDPASDIIASFLKEHDIGRGYVRATVEGINIGNAIAVAENLTAYGALLTEHIKKEDEILYPWMNRSLSDSQVGQLFSKFAQVNEEYRVSAAQQVAFVEKLDKKLSQ